MTEAQAQSIFVLAGIEILRMWELPNAYWAKVHHPPPTGPWWLIKTHAGLIEIGWRKRVINIDWSDTKIEMIVTEDQVTKSNYYVHAYSNEDAIKYLSKLAATIHSKKPIESPL